MPEKVLIINGPNLGHLGKRETHIYGGQGMEYVLRNCEKKGWKRFISNPITRDGSLTGWKKPARNF